MWIFDKLVRKTNSNANFRDVECASIRTDPAMIMKIVNDYGNVLEKLSKQSDIMPLSALPYDKETIKEAIRAALQLTSDKSMVDILKSGYVLLAGFVSDEEFSMATEGRAFLMSTSTDKSNMLYANKYLEVQNAITQDTIKLSNELK